MGGAGAVAATGNGHIAPAADEARAGRRRSFAQADAKGVIQIFNVGAERMLGYTAAEVMNTITPADISDPQELVTRAQTLSAELATPITPGFEALVSKAS